MEQGLSQDAGHTWPELVGKKYEEAEKAIKDANPELNVVRVPENSMVTMDYRIDRVRLFVDEDGIVVSPPRTG
ncbi:hypothetical protein BsWGS_17610 [Bradybaena similaris]